MALGHSHPPFRDYPRAGSRRADPAGRCRRAYDPLERRGRIVREYPEPDSYITNNGKKAIILSMEMREGHNIVRYGKEVDEVLHAFERDLPESVSIRRIADQPKVVGDSVSSFVRDLFVSIVVVILVMMVLFPFRSALVAATSIPISVFISIGVMYACGIPLNTVTLAALIVVLGMIVDNSIIVIDAIWNIWTRAIPVGTPPSIAPRTISARSCWLRCVSA